MRCSVGRVEIDHPALEHRHREAYALPVGEEQHVHPSDRDFARIFALGDDDVRAIDELLGLFGDTVSATHSLKAFGQQLSALL